MDFDQIIAKEIDELQRKLGVIKSKSHSFDRPDMQLFRKYMEVLTSKIEEMAEQEGIKLS